MAGLVPAISLRDAHCPPKRDHRDKPGDDKLSMSRPQEAFRRKNFQTANTPLSLFFEGAGHAGFPFSVSPKRGMERREAPGAGEAPLGGPCDRPACAPCEGARPRVKRGRCP